MLTVAGCRSHASSLAHVREATLAGRSARFDVRLEGGAAFGMPQRVTGAFRFDGRAAVSDTGTERSIFYQRVHYGEIPADLGPKQWIELPNPHDPTDLVLFYQPFRRLLAVPGALDHVRLVGRQRVGGATARRYRGTLDPTKVENRRDRRLLREDFDGRPIDVWLDSRDRLVRIGLMFEGGRPLKRARITFTFTDFGVDVPAVPPPREDVENALRLPSYASPLPEGLYDASAMCAIEIGFERGATARDIATLRNRVGERIRGVSTTVLVPREETIRRFIAALRRERLRPAERARLVARAHREAGAVLLASPVTNRDVPSILRALRELPSAVASVAARDSCDD